MSRADRVAARLGRARGRPAARHRPRQPPLPDRLHRHERDGGRRAGHAPLHHRLPLRRAGEGRGRAASTCERAPQELAAALKTGWPEGDAAARLRGPAPQRAPARAAARAAPRPHRARRRPAALVEAERAVKEPEEVEAIRAAAALADDIYDVGAASGAWSAGPSARSRSRSRRRCAAAARAARASPRSSPRPSTARCRTRSRATSRSPPACSSRSTSARGSTATARTARAPGRRASSTTTSPRSTTSCCARRRRRSTPSAPGPTGREVDAVARDLIAAAGHGDHFGHGLGHGVGLEVHEAPRLARSGTDALEAGNVVTVEPGVYVPGPRRGADRGPRRRDRGRPRRAQRDRRRRCVTVG